MGFKLLAGECTSWRWWCDASPPTGLLEGACLDSCMCLGGTTASLLMGCPLACRNAGEAAKVAGMRLRSLHLGDGAALVDLQAAGWLTTVPV